MHSMTWSLHVDSNVSGQPGRTHRLIRVFAWHAGNFVAFGTGTIDQVFALSSVGHDRCAVRNGRN